LDRCALEALAYFGRLLGQLWNVLMLTIRPDQQQTLADDEFRERAVSFLRADAAEATKDATDAELHATVDRAMVTGREIGVTSERELVKWALVGVITRGSAFDDERVKGPLREIGPEDQTKVDALLHQISQEILWRA
jgi:hypothetical protein